MPGGGQLNLPSLGPIKDLCCTQVCDCECLCVCVHAHTRACIFFQKSLERHCGYVKFCKVASESEAHILQCGAVDGATA